MQKGINTRLRIQALNRLLSYTPNLTMKVWDLGGVPGDVCDHSDVHHPNQYQPKIEKDFSNE